MPVSDGRIIDAAKVYSRQLDLGKSEPDARDEVYRMYPGFSDRQLDEVVYEAQRGREIADSLNAQIGKKSRTLASVCGGDPDCVGSVGVRVEVIRTLTDGTEDVRTIYLPLDWSSTMGDVGKAVGNFLDAGPSRGYNTKAAKYRFAGPTRWPGESPNLGELQ